MPDYRNMTAVEAMRHAREVSGLTTEVIAARAGISVAVMRRYFQQQEGYLPGLDRIAPLCAAMNNRVILEWLLAQFETEPETCQASSRADVLGACARASATLGDCQRCLADNALITPAIAKEIRSILKDVEMEIDRARGMLVQLASERDCANALASFRRGTWREKLAENILKLWRRG